MVFRLLSGDGSQAESAVKADKQAEAVIDPIPFDEMVEELPYTRSDPWADEESVHKLHMAPIVQTSTLKQKWYMGMGDVSTILSFISMIACICVFYLLPREYHEDGTWERYAVLYALSFTLYSFAGGATNWLAVKMLFDRIPFIIGSGVIPRQFKAIRETIKDTIMVTFFSPEFLESYISQQAQENGDLIEGTVMKFNLNTHIQAAIETPDFERKVEETMHWIARGPQGGMLRSMGLFYGGTNRLVKKSLPLMKLALQDFGKEIAVRLETGVVSTVKDIGSGTSLSSLIDIHAVRQEIDRLMTKKLEELTPEIVRDLMQQVMKEHLGWLIVWGNVFGGIVGVLSMAAGFGPS